jgi:hypothetical protein
VLDDRRRKRWRANEMVMRGLTRQPDARYRSRDKAVDNLAFVIDCAPRARTASPRSSRPSHQDATAPSAENIDCEVLEQTTARTSRHIATPFSQETSGSARSNACPA